MKVCVLSSFFIMCLTPFSLLETGTAVQNRHAARVDYSVATPQKSSTIDSVKIWPYLTVDLKA
jgi:hypothetical protein